MAIIGDQAHRTALLGPPSDNPRTGTLCVGLAEKEELAEKDHLTRPEGGGQAGLVTQGQGCRRTRSAHSLSLSLCLSLAENQDLTRPEGDGQGWWVIRGPGCRVTRTALRALRSHPARGGRSGARAQVTRPCTACSASSPRPSAPAPKAMHCHCVVIWNQNLHSCFGQVWSHYHCHHQLFGTSTVTLSW